MLLPDGALRIHLCDEIDCTENAPRWRLRLQWWSALGGRAASCARWRRSRCSTRPRREQRVHLRPFSQGVLQREHFHGRNDATGQTAVDAGILAADRARRLFSYGGRRRARARAHAEDDGVAMHGCSPRTVQGRRSIGGSGGEATYYDDNQQGLEPSTCSAAPFVRLPATWLRHEQWGQQQRRVHVPGTDVLFPRVPAGSPVQSLACGSALAASSMRDVDYLALASAIDQSSVSAATSTRWFAERPLGVRCHGPTNDLLVFVCSGPAGAIRSGRLGARATLAAHCRRTVGSRRGGGGRPRRPLSSTLRRRSPS